MPIITKYGLRKNLEKIIAVGNNRYEAIKAFLENTGPGEKGILFEDDLGFYIWAENVKDDTSNQRTYYLRRINHEDTVVIGYKKPVWVVYDVVLK